MSDQDRMDNTTTAIGPSIVIRGKLKSAEDLVVKGRIEAEISSSKALFVENSGIIKANLKVQSAKVSGVVVGNITAEQKLEIAQDGRVIGDLLAPSIVLNDGAAFRGNIDMQTFDTPHAEKGARAMAEPVAMPEVAAVGAGDEGNEMHRGNKRKR
jgi:cytoskeletal protein CcmA (bactofilin family)